MTEKSLRATGGVRMNAASIILLALISSWAVFSAIYSHKHSGSCGGCPGCSACKGNVGDGLKREILSGKGSQAENLIEKDPAGKDHKGKGSNGKGKDSKGEITYTCSGSCGTCPYHMK
jgi:ferredoxin